MGVGIGDLRLKIAEFRLNGGSDLRFKIGDLRFLRTLNYLF